MTLSTSDPKKTYRYKIEIYRSCIIEYINIVKKATRTSISNTNSVSQFNCRRDSGFVGIEPVGLDAHQKPQIDNDDDESVVEHSRRQSRMFSIDFDFLEPDEDQDRIVNKCKQVFIYLCFTIPFYDLSRTIYISFLIHLLLFHVKLSPTSTLAKSYLGN